MSKHTAGPWHVANGCQIRSAKDQIAKAWMMRDGEGQANARLIAAAPDLVEALECMIIGACAVAVPHNGERAVLQDAVNIARAAIAKATGEAQ